MRVSAKTDYAIRAALELAAAGDSKPVKGERIATAQAIPLRFLENILMQLRHAGLVDSRRGAEGGYRLARPAGEVTLADVIRAELQLGEGETLSAQLSRAEADLLELAEGQIVHVRVEPVSLPAT